jgi:hypothetical protein
MPEYPYYPWRPEYKPPMPEEILPGVTREAFEQGVVFLGTIGVAVGVPLAIYYIISKLSE